LTDQSERARQISSLVWWNYWLGTLALALAFVAGVVTSLGNDDWTWFARFGSVMVAISILLFSISYVQDSSVSLRGINMPKAELRLLRLSMGTGTEEERLTLLEELIELLEQDTRRTREALDRIQSASKQYYLAAIGAGVGTLVWGFGDLVVKLF